MKHRNQPKKVGATGLIVVGLLAIVAIEFATGAPSSLYLYYFYDYAETTEGRIIQSDMIDVRNVRYSWGVEGYDIKYSYVVDGIEYIGDRVEFGVKWVDRRKAIELINEYLVDDRVDVFFDPRSPRHSTLVPDKIQSSVFFKFLIIPLVWFVWLVGR